MKITNKGIIQTANGVNVELFIEREGGKYNNVGLFVELRNSEIEGYTQDQIVTKAWHREKWRAIQVFDRVWECRADEDALETAIAPADEADNPVDFQIIELPVVEIPPAPVIEPQVPYVSDDQKAIDLMKYLMQSDEFLLLVGIQPKPKVPEQEVTV